MYLLASASIPWQVNVSPAVSHPCTSCSVMPAGCVFPSSLIGIFDVLREMTELFLVSPAGKLSYRKKTAVWFGQDLAMRLAHSDLLQE
jgi:hypothetical protein